MEETPEEYAQRTVAYVLNSKKAVKINDPSLQPISKAESEKPVEKALDPTDPLDIVLKDYAEYGAPVTKATPNPKPKTTSDQIDELLKAYGQSRS